MADARSVANSTANRAIVEQAIKMREDARRTVERARKAVEQARTQCAEIQRVSLRLARSKKLRPDRCSGEVSPIEQV